MKILHTGDLHLDSAFSGSTESYSHTRRARQREVLKKIFHLAQTECCDMMLIAGDLFDTSFVTPETRELCLSLFREFEKPIVISTGNHDPYVNGSFWKSELPENVWVFCSPSLEYFDFPELGVAVGGYGFTSQALNFNPLENQQPRERTYEKLLLLCAHTDLDSPLSRYAPIMSSDIKRLGFDYAALGHKHNLPETQQQNIRYCGFAEGRSYDEKGEGGVVMISFTDGELEVSRRSVSEYKYVWEELDVSALSSAEEIADAVKGSVDKLCEKGISHLRLELCGIIPADLSLNLSELESIKNERVAELQIIDSTLALPDKDSLEKDSTLRGEFYRSLRPCLYSDDPRERRLSLRALRIGLAAIDGKSFTEGGAI